MVKPKKIFLPCVLLASLSLAGCSDSTPSTSIPVEFEENIVGDSPEPDEENSIGALPIIKAVANFDIAATTPNSISLRWFDDQDGSLVASYELFRNGQLISTINDGLLSYTDTNLEALKEYQYSIRTVSIEGLRSDEVIVIATTRENTAPIFMTEPGVFVVDSNTPATSITALNAKDKDGDSISYRFSPESMVQDVFTIDELGSINVAGSLATVAGQVFNLTVEASDGYSISQASLQIGVPSKQAGIVRDVYQSGSINDTIESLINNDKYPSLPDETSIETSMDSPRDIGSNYGQRMHGYLVPRVSGDYTFWIASDDHGELHLSTSESPSDSQLIASVAGSTNANQWAKFTSQQSHVVALEAGRFYYLKALMAEKSGHDLLQVAWQGPGFDRQIITEEFLRPPLDMQAPSPAADLRYIKTAENTVLLEWTAAKDDTGISEYRIYNKDTLLGTSVENQVSLTHLISAKTYEFTVVAVDNNGNVSSPSNRVIVLMNDTIAPSAPSQLSASNINQNSVKLNWLASKDENQKSVLYKVYQNEALIQSTFDTSLTINALEPSTEYIFSLEAVDQVGNSTVSDQTLSITTLESNPNEPVFSQNNYEFGLFSDNAIHTPFAQVTASDPNSQSIAYRILSNPNNGPFIINTNGELQLSSAFIDHQPQQYSLQIQADNGQYARITNVVINKLSSASRAENGLSFELWSSISGNAIADLNTTLAPNRQGLITDFEVPSNIGNNYGQRIRGLLKAPATGNYSFWIASDDSSELHLSSDLSPSHTELIAQINGYTGVRNWNDSFQVKKDIWLEAGQLYFIQALHKEGSGGDYLSVAWQTPDMSKKELLTGEHLLPYSKLLPPTPIVSSAVQSGFEHSGDQITLTLTISEQGAGFPVTVYYGLMDGGEDANAWQYSLELGPLSEGAHTIELSDLLAGLDYQIRVQSQGLAGTAWSDAIHVATVTLDPDKQAGEALPETLSLVLDVNDVEQHIELSKHSVRSPDFQLLTYDERRSPQFMPVTPMPEARTYRGYISNNPFVVVTGVIDDSGTIHMSGWTGGARAWVKRVEVSEFIDPNALGNESMPNQEILLGTQIPANEDNRLYIPQPGDSFHNNLARVSFKHENPQFISQAGGNINNALAQMEGHINETDYIWAQKTGLRWDMGRALIEVYGNSGNATDARPPATDSTNFSVDFQNRKASGLCFGGGNWVGCIASYTVHWGYPHEIGHNMGLGHDERADNANHTQAPSTQLSNMQSRKTISKLQRGTRFKASKAIKAPMLPAAFKDYATVYKNQNIEINPLANDYDANGDQLHIDSFEAETREGGQVIQMGDTLHYTPPGDYTGVDQFTYTASDGEYKTVGAIQIQVVKEGLTAHWDMEQIEGEQVTDLSGEGNHLYAYGSDAIDYINAGISGNGMKTPLIASKEGVKDAVGHKLLPHKLEPGHNSFSASIWFKYSDIAGKKLIMGKSNTTAARMGYGGWEIRSEENSLVMQVTFRDRLMKNNAFTIKQEEAIADGNWHHAVVVIDRDAQLLTGYIDGQLMTQAVTLPNTYSPILSAMNYTRYGGGTPFRIGDHTKKVCDEEGKDCTAPEGQSYDNAQIFHKALTAQEVKALYQN